MKQKILNILITSSLTVFSFISSISYAKFIQNPLSAIARPNLFITYDNSIDGKSAYGDPWIGFFIGDPSEDLELKNIGNPRLTSFEFNNLYYDPQETYTPPQVLDSKGNWHELNTFINQAFKNGFDISWGSDGVPQKGKNGDYIYDTKNNHIIIGSKGIKDSNEGIINQSYSRTLNISNNKFIFENKIVDRIKSLPNKENDYGYEEDSFIGNNIIDLKGKQNFQGFINLFNQYTPQFELSYYNKDFSATSPNNQYVLDLSYGTEYDKFDTHGFYKGYATFLNPLAGLNKIIIKTNDYRREIKSYNNKVYLIGSRLSKREDFQFETSIKIDIPETISSTSNPSLKNYELKIEIIPNKDTFYFMRSFIGTPSSRVVYESREREKESLWDKKMLDVPCIVKDVKKLNSNNDEDKELLKSIFESNLKCSYIRSKVEYFPKDTEKKYQVDMALVVRYDFTQFPYYYKYTKKPPFGVADDGEIPYSLLKTDNVEIETRSINKLVNQIKTGSFERKLVGFNKKDLQNFANWYSFYNTRWKLQKASLMHAARNISSNVRVTWQSQLGKNNQGNSIACDRFVPTDKNDEVDKNYIKYCRNNIIKSFDNQHKHEFYRWITDISSSDAYNPPTSLKEYLKNDDENRPNNSQHIAAAKRVSDFLKNYNLAWFNDAYISDNQQYPFFRKEESAVYSAKDTKINSWRIEDKSNKMFYQSNVPLPDDTAECRVNNNLMFLVSGYDSDSKYNKTLELSQYKIGNDPGIQLNLENIFSSDFSLSQPYNSLSKDKFNKPKSVLTTHYDYNYDYGKRVSYPVFYKKNTFLNPLALKEDLSSFLFLLWASDLRRDMEDVVPAKDVLNSPIKYLNTINKGSKGDGSDSPILTRFWGILGDNPSTWQNLSSFIVGIEDTSRHPLSDSGYEYLKNKKDSYFDPSAYMAKPSKIPFLNKKYNSHYNILNGAVFSRGSSIEDSDVSSINLYLKNFVKDINNTSVLNSTYYTFKNEAKVKNKAGYEVAANIVFNLSYISSSWSSILKKDIETETGKKEAVQTWIPYALLNSTYKDDLGGFKKRNVYFNYNSNLEKIQTSGSYQKYPELIKFENILSGKKNKSDYEKANKDLIEYLLGNDSFEEKNHVESSLQTSEDKKIKKGIAGKYAYPSPPKIYLKREGYDELVYGYFRSREGLLGDIVNSNLNYLKGPKLSVSYANQIEYASKEHLKNINLNQQAIYEDNRKEKYSHFISETINKRNSGTVFVGANDGFLHAFDDDPLSYGKERWAFLPSGVIKERKLSNYADPYYQHNFYVDGKITIADAYDYEEYKWKTVLIGSLGAGGRGIYALDITDVDKPKLLWELDDFGGGESMGYIFSNALISPVKTNKGVRWYAVVSGGYKENGKDKSGKASLYFIDIFDKKMRGDPNAKPAKILTVQGRKKVSDNEYMNNGLSQPLLINLNSDGFFNRIYAGDLQGNMWAFSVYDEKGNFNPITAFNNNPLFTAPDSLGDIQVAKKSNKTQAISTPPVGALHSQGGVLISFSTGRKFEESDINSNKEVGQGIYVIRDTSVGSDLMDGVQKTNGNLTKDNLLDLQMTVKMDGGVDIGRVISQKEINWKRYNGWYVKLPYGEQNIQDPYLIVNDVFYYIPSFSNKNLCLSNPPVVVYSFNLEKGLTKNKLGRKDDSTVGVSSVLGKDSNGKNIYFAIKNENAPISDNEDTPDYLREFLKNYANKSMINSGGGRVTWRELEM